MPILPKPATCSACSLQYTGTGFAPLDGPRDSLLYIVGEALGAEEVASGRPFVGPAGRKLTGSLERMGMERSQVCVGNVVSCRPPDNRLVGAPWEHSAISHCRIHRQPLYDSNSNRTYLTLGVTATRTILKEVLGIDYTGKIDNWHGYVLTRRDSAGEPPYVVPTYHPSYLLQGNQKLTGVFLHDIKRAMEVASFGFQPSEVSLVEDPDPDWFQLWVEEIPEDCWLAVDIETAIKTGEAEDDLDVPVGSITRVNFSHTPAQGISVPWAPLYSEAIRLALLSPCTKTFHNESYDVPILKANGYQVNGTILDSMWAWHMLQSDLPKGLGFVAPFYSSLPPWKHMSNVSQSYYGAMDGVQQLRIMFGIAKDLKASGQWESFLRYSSKLDSLVLHPMEEVGILLNVPAMLDFQSRLKSHSSGVWEAIQALVPEDLKPLSPKGGWKRKPHESVKGVIELDVECEILSCDTCGASPVKADHQCSPS